MFNVSMIVAYDQNRAIGKGNQLLWDLPDDLADFKQITLNKTIVMGRKTFESIGRLLPGRQNVILTKQLDYKLPESKDINTSGIVISDVKELFDLQKNKNMRSPEEVIVIGGAQIYEVFLERKWVDKIYVTEVEGDFKGDAFFPNLGDYGGQWGVSDIRVHKKDERHNYQFKQFILKQLRVFR